MLLAHLAHRPAGRDRGRRWSPSSRSWSRRPPSLAMRSYLTDRLDARCWTRARAGQRASRPRRGGGCRRRTSRRRRRRSGRARRRRRRAARALGTLTAVFDDGRRPAAYVIADDPAERAPTSTSCRCSSDARRRRPSTATVAQRRPPGLGRLPGRDRRRPRRTGRSSSGCRPMTSRRPLESLVGWSSLLDRSVAWSPPAASAWSWCAGSSARSGRSPPPPTRSRSCRSTAARSARPSGYPTGPHRPAHRGGPGRRRAQHPARPTSSPRSTRGTAASSRSASSSPTPPTSSAPRCRPSRGTPS